MSHISSVSGPVTKKQKTNQKEAGKKSVEENGGPKIITLFDNSPHQKCYYQSVLRYTDDKYLVSRNFHNLCKIIDSPKELDQEHIISISGPKGVGKSLSLAAVASSEYYKENKIPCLLYSPLDGGKPPTNLFSAALKEVYGQFDKGKEYKKIEKTLPIERIIDSFVQTFPKCLILMEFGGVTSLDIATQRSLMLIMSHMDEVQFVVSLSSGSLNFVSPDDLTPFKNQVLNIQTTRHQVIFEPFTEQEALMWMDKHSSLYPLTPEFYYRITNYNPRLLIRCAGCTTENDAEESVLAQVQLCMNEVRKSMEMASVTRFLESSMLMLYYAYNGEDIPMDQMDAYLWTWVKKEDLTYIVEEDANHFKLAVNYPLLYQPLMDMLGEIDRERDIMVANSEIAHCVRFEAITCKKIPHLEVCYGSKNKVENTCTLYVQAYAGMGLDQPVRELKLGVLYHLRPFHPVIDAVGYLQDRDKQPWLVLVQVSLSDYIEHNSKAEDLSRPPVKCERTVDKEAKSWLQYYRDRIKAVEKRVDVRQMYIYVSPEDFIEEGKVYDTLEKYSPLLLSNDFFFGLVLKSSKTEELVNQYVSKSRCKSEVSM